MFQNEKVGIKIKIFAFKTKKWELKFVYSAVNVLIGHLNIFTVCIKVFWFEKKKNNEAINILLCLKIIEIHYGKWMVIEEWKMGN